MKTPIGHELILVTLLALVLSGSALGETVFVKYRDTPVDVDNGHFNKIDLKPSSLVKGMYYDSNNRYLLVRLKQTFYHYCGIPKKVVVEWIKADSAGRYYRSNIKGD